MKPANAYESLQLLASYHQQRQAAYRRLAGEAHDERAGVLFRQLEGLENSTVRVLRDEIEHLRPGRTVYLMSGPTLSIDPAHVMDCRCDGEPDFDEALGCALSASEAPDEVIDRLAGCSPARSVQELADRLRELERMQQRQIAKFTRDD